MHLIYLDESGNTGTHKDPDQQIHMIAGLCVHESEIRPIELAVFTICQAPFDALIKEPGFELHGADLYSGNNIFKGISPKKRVACVHDILDALIEHKTKVMWAAVDKMKLSSSRHPHQIAFQFLVERVEDWLQRSNAGLGLLVADENKEVEQNLIDDLDLYKKDGTGWGWRPTYISSIVDSIHFVQSKNNKLIQCVDLVAYFSLKHFRQQQQLIADFRAAQPMSMLFPIWRDGELAKSQKKQAIYEIGAKLDKLTVNRKLWPE